MIFAVHDLNYKKKQKKQKKNKQTNNVYTRHKSLHRVSGQKNNICEGLR